MLHCRVLCVGGRACGWWLQITVRQTKAEGALIEKVARLKTAAAQVKLCQNICRASKQQLNAASAHRIRPCFLISNQVISFEKCIYFPSLCHSILIKWKTSDVAPPSAHAEAFRWLPCAASTQPTASRVAAADDPISHYH